MGSGQDVFSNGLIICLHRRNIIPARGREEVLRPIAVAYLNLVLQLLVDNLCDRLRRSKRWRCGTAIEHDVALNEQDTQLLLECCQGCRRASWVVVRGVPLSDEPRPLIERTRVGAR